MIVITGGKYQGKLKCVYEVYDCTEEDVFDFAKINSREYAEGGMDYRTRKVWVNVQEYVRMLALSGTEEFQLEKMVKKLIENNNPEVLVISEVGAGVIPLDAKDVIFREVTGRLAVLYADKAEEVYRVICGLTVRLK